MIRLITLIVFTFFLFCLIFILSSFNKTCWLGKTNFNLVIQANNLFIYSFHSNEGLNIISFPQKTYLPVAKAYGEYDLTKIFSLGETEDISGGELLKISLQNFFKAPMDGFLVLKDPLKCQLNLQDLEKGRLTSLYVCLLKGEIATDLTFLDIFKLFKELSFLKINQVDLVRIEETKLYQEEYLADQSEIWKIDPVLIDDFSQKQFADQKILVEKLGLAVVNKTNYPKLAKEASRLLNNIGGEVLLISSKTDRSCSQSSLFYQNKDLKNSYTFKKVLRTFKVSQKGLKSELKTDLELVLCQDYLNLFYIK